MPKKHEEFPALWMAHSECHGSGTRTVFKDGRMQKILCPGCSDGSVRRPVRPSIIDRGNEGNTPAFLSPLTKEERKAAYERGLAQATEMKSALLNAIESSKALFAQQKFSARFVIENGDPASNATYEMLCKIRADWAGVIQSTDNLMKLLVSYESACWDVSQNKRQF